MWVISSYVSLFGSNLRCLKTPYEDELPRTGLRDLYKNLLFCTVMQYATDT